MNSIIIYVTQFFVAGYTISWMAAIIGALIYFVPVLKGLSTTEGKIAFKNKVQKSGFLGMLSLFGLQLDKNKFKIIND